MINVKDIKTKRFQFLHKLYEETGGTKWKTSTKEDIGKKVGLDISETNGIVDYLQMRNLFLLQKLP